MPILHSGASGVEQRDEGGPPSPGTSANDEGDGRAAAAPGVSGPLRPLDPRRISLDRTIGAIAGLLIGLLHVMSVPVVWLTGAWPDWAVLALALAWPLNLVALAWLAVRWPEIDYRHWRYRVDAQGIQIWSGVIWRQVVSVPRSRVQHIDVSQGPLERSYGLATLSVYTAGTRYSKVDLPGLDHGVALALRDGLLPKDAEPAV